VFTIERGKVTAIDLIMDPRQLDELEVRLD